MIVKTDWSGSSPENQQKTTGGARAERFWKKRKSDAGQGFTPRRIVLTAGTDAGSPEAVSQEMERNWQTRQSSTCWMPDTCPCGMWWTQSTHCGSERGSWWWKEETKIAGRITAVRSIEYNLLLSITSHKVKIIPEQSARIRTFVPIKF